MQGLYVILNHTHQSPKEMLHLCRQVLRGGADIVQYRNKQGHRAQILPIAMELASLCHEADVPFLLNDYPQWVEDVGADGAHIGQQDLSIAEARMYVGPERLLGVSASHPKAARAAEQQGADYVGCGHVFATTTKPKGFEPIGVDGLAAVVRSVGIPVFAIGGIFVERVGKIVSMARPAGIVLVSALSFSEDPASVCKECKELLLTRDFKRTKPLSMSTKST